MIRLTCTNCHATLEIDDAFAGGVCRCQHCGTIQTVPAHLKGNASVAAGGGATAQKQKSLYQNQRRPREQEQTGRGGGTGLDELSEAVASSGLGRSGLRNSKAGLLDAGAVTPAGIDYASPSQQKNPAMVWIVVGGAVAGLLLLGMLGYFFLASSVTVVTTPARVAQVGTSAAPGPSVNAGGDDEAAAIRGTPRFCGVDLADATSVVYVLDRGSASAETLDTLKAATRASLETLGPRRKFAIVFWQAGSEPIVSFPQQGMIEATPGNIADAARAMEDVVAQGRSDPAPAIDNAAARDPSDAVFVTAKADEIDDDVVAQVGSALAGKRVHAFAIGAEGNALQTIARQQNGNYRLLNKKQLDTFSRGE